MGGGREGAGEGWGVGGGTVTEAEVQKNVSDSRYKHEAVHTHVRLVFKLLSNDNSVVPTDSHCFGLSVLCCAALILQTGESGGGGGGKKGGCFPRKDETRESRWCGGQAGDKETGSKHVHLSIQVTAQT